MHKNPIYYMQKALATGAKNAPVHYLGTDFGTIPISETILLSLKILSEIRAAILPTSANWRRHAQNHSELIYPLHKIVANHMGSFYEITRVATKSQNVFSSIPTKSQFGKDIYAPTKPAYYTIPKHR